MIINDAHIRGLIQSAHLISNHQEAEIRNCAYTLHAGTVFRPETGLEELLVPRNGFQGHSWEIGPSETLVVMTQESVQMPDDLCATYAPLFRLAKQGLLLLNASIVEPGYKGPLSCFLANFSARPIAVAKGSPVAKIVFHSLESAPETLVHESIPESTYKQLLSEYAKSFHRTFLDVTGIETRAVTRARRVLRNWVVGAGAMIGILLLWSSLEPLLSRWLWERHGILTESQRVEDARLLKDLEAARAELRALVGRQQDEAALRKQLDAVTAEVNSLRLTRRENAQKRP